MRWLKALLCVLLLALALAPVGAAEPSFPERGRSAVVDAAGVIPDLAEAELDARIVAWVHRTGHQFAVVTVPSLEGYAIEDYGNRLLRHWGLGRAGADDGAILLLAPNERQVRIEVGYGLEGALTDALSHRIIADTIRPALRRGDVAGALSDGADRIMAAAALDPADARAMNLAAEQATRRRGPSLGLILLIGIPALVIAGVAAIVIYEERRRRRVEREQEEYRLEEEERRKVRLRRQWETQKAEGRTSFATFDDYYADFLAREKAKEAEKIRQYLERHANDRPPSSGSFASDSSPQWSTSDSSDWGSSATSSSSWDSGYDSGGGSGGGGGASDSY